MVGVNYVAGSLNRTKRKANANTPGIASFTNPTPAARVRGRPLFSRPPPVISTQPERNGKRKRYIDTAHYPSGSSSIPDNDSPQQDQNPGGRPKVAAGRSGLDGIDFPWTLAAREVYLEERRVDEMRRRNEAGMGEQDGEEAEAELRYMRSRVHEAKRRVEGEVRRGKRRWWNAFQGDGGGGSRDIMRVEDEDRLGAEMDADDTNLRLAAAEGWVEGSPGWHCINHRETSRDIDRERHIFVDLLNEHDLLHIRRLEPTTDRSCDTRQSRSDPLRQLRTSFHPT